MPVFSASVLFGFVDYAGGDGVFMIRGWMLANNLTAFTYPQTPYFTNVPASNEFFPYVEKMVQLGFWQGCTSPTYCQGKPVTRDQMAPMILRSMVGTP